MADDTDERPSSPPTCSWGTLNNMFARMEKEGVPGRVDKSYLVGMAGGTQANVKRDMRSMGLINADGSATALLVEMATQPEKRPELIATVIREQYAPLADLPETATRGQLDEVFRDVYGYSGDTIRKAVAFFVSAATFAGMPLSPHIRPKPGRPSGAGTVTAPRRSKARKRTTAEQTKPEVAAQTQKRNPEQRTVTLPSGATLTLDCSVPLLTLPAAELGDVLDLVREFDSLAGKIKGARAKVTAKPSHHDDQPTPGEETPAGPRDTDAEGQ